MGSEMASGPDSGMALVTRSGLDVETARDWTRETVLGTCRGDSGMQAVVVKACSIVSGSQAVAVIDACCRDSGIQAVVVDACCVVSRTQAEAIVDACHGGSATWAAFVYRAELRIRAGHLFSVEMLSQPILYSAS